ncbi:TetR/AcrR family transcriptional regulator [Vibrio atypicus]|jgi:TetR/AcrR family transcriptional regulator of autoinduction and epiphytic fitness|uniref:TetR/AcrR family transcriptional regulator n=1 Tax=Vibrio atypicus TaxID=558271 RepID=UPI00135AE17E|nr:TetR/AcrR family transcriptional regulator [Vibrio atypicus]
MKLSEKKRLALIEAAQSEFIEHGFAAANMDRVCELAGASKRTLYRHFSSKDVLFFEAVKSAHQGQSPCVQLDYDPNTDLELQLAAYLRAKLNFLYQDFGLPLARMVISEFIRTPELAESYLQQLQQKDEQLENWFMDAIADRKLKNQDPAKMSNMLMCLLNGNFMWPQLVANQEVPSNEQQEQIIGDMLQLFLNGYRC